MSEFENTKSIDYVRVAEGTTMSLVGAPATRGSVGPVVRHPIADRSDRACWTGAGALGLVADASRPTSSASAATKEMPRRQRAWQQEAARTWRQRKKKRTDDTVVHLT